MSRSDPEMNPEPNLVPSVYKRIASLLPIQTGCTVAQVEMDPFFLVSRKPLLGSVATPIIKDIINCSCDILEDIHQKDDSTTVLSKQELSLRSILVIVRLLADLTESNWTSQEPGKFRTPSKDYFSDSSITAIGDGASKIIYHTVQPRSIDSLVAQRAINIITTLKPDIAIEKEICRINETNYQSKPHPYRSLIDNIDLNCDSVLRYLAASNPTEYREFIMVNLRALKNVSYKEHQYVAASQLLEFVYFDEAVFYEYIKDIWPSFGYIKRNLYQLLILSFFSTGIQHTIIARPAKYLSEHTINEKLIQEIEAFVDHIYSQYEGTKYHRSTYRILSIFISCIPKTLEQSLLKNNKLKSTFNKKQKFIHHIAKSVTNSENAKDFECIVIIFRFAAAVYPLDPDHPLVKFCLAHYDTVYKSMRSHSSNNIPKGRDQELVLMNELRIEFYCAATVLKPEVCLTELVAFVKENQTEMKKIALCIRVVRGISEVPAARRYFDIYMNELAGTFKSIMTKSSRIVEETAHEMNTVEGLSHSTSVESSSSGGSAHPPPSFFANTAPVKFNKPQEILDSSTTNSPFNQNYKVSTNDSRDSSSTDSSKSELLKNKLKHSKTPKTGSEINTSFYKRSNDLKYYSRDILTNILLIFGSCPYLYFDIEKDLVSKLSIPDYYDAVSTNVRELITPLSIAFCDPDFKLSEAAAKFSMNLMDEEFIKDNIEYYASSFAGSGHILLSLANSFHEYNLTDPSLKKLYTFFINFFESRHRIVSKYPKDGLIYDFGCHVAGRCNSIISAIERTFLIALCAPDMDMYRLTKRGIAIVLKERELENNHHDICFNSGTLDLFCMINDDTQIVTGLVALHKKLRKMLKTIKATKAVIESWEYVYKRWSALAVKADLDQNEIVEFRNYSGFLGSICGCFLRGKQNEGFPEEIILPQIKEFINVQVKLLSSDDLITRESSKDILSNEIHPAACSIVVGDLTKLAESIKYKDEKTSSDLVLIEQIVAIICSLAEGDATDVFLMLHNYYQPCKTIYSILKKLDESLNVLKLKIRFCKLGVILESRRSEIGLEGNLKLKNLNTRILSDWLEKAIFPDVDQLEKQTSSSNILASRFSDRTSLKKSSEAKQNSMSHMHLDLAVESSKALSLKLEGLALEASQAANEKELKRSRDMAFANYFSLFYRILEKFSSTFIQNVDTISRHRISLVSDNIILCLTNLLKSNVEVGLKYALPLGISEDHKIRVAIIQVFANIVDGFNSNLDNFSDDRIDSVSDELCKVLAANPDFSISVAAVSPTADVDPLASSLLSLFGYYGNMKDIFHVLIKNEIGSITRSVDILRRNSVTTRMLALFANKHGNDYLHLILRPLIDQLYANEDYFEVEKLVAGDEGAENNLRLFISYLTQMVEGITDSIDIVPPEFKFICSCIYDTVKETFPNSAAVAVGSFMFLRFFCPSIVNPETAGIFTELPDRRLKRSLIQLAKVIQNMANGSLSSVKWPLLASQMNKLNELNDKLFDFLGRLSGSDPDFVFSPAVEETPIADVQFLHRFLYYYRLEIRKDYLGEGWNQTERISVFSQVDVLLSKLGQPKAAYGSEIPAILRSVLDSGNNLYEFMSKYMKGDIETYMDIPIVQNALAKDGTPMVVVNMYYVQTISADPELLAFRVFQIACKFWDSKFFVIIDCTGFNTDYPYITELTKLFSFHAADAFAKGCARIYYYNISQVFYPQVIDGIKAAASARLYDPRVTEMNFYSAADDIRTLSQLSLCDYSNKVLKDARVVFSDVSLYQPDQNRFIPVTVKVGSQYVQIIFNNPSKIKFGNSLKGVRLVDIYAISEISNAEISNYIGVPNELSFMVGANRIVLTSSKKIEIMRTIYFASSRLSQNDQEDDDMGLDSAMNLENWMGELVNVDFSGLISDDEAIRAAAFRLLGSLSKCLDLNLGGGIESVVKATFPRDSASFVIKISQILSKKFASTTYEFIKGFFTCYEKLSQEQKLSAIMYIAPWINNIYEYVFAADEEGGPERTSELIGNFCKLSLQDRNLLPSFNGFIWNKLCLEDRISSVLLDEIVAVAIDRKAEGSDWDEIISLVSLTPTVEICGQVVYRLREIIHIPKSEGESSIVAHGSWVEITVLIKLCVSLFFNSIIFAEMFLPDILFIVTVFLDTGPLELRENLQKLLINVIHSFLAKENLSDSQRDSILATVKRIGGQRANMLFGLNRESDDSNSTDAVQMASKVTGLEIFCEILINFIGTIGDANSRSIWRVRWNAYVVDAVFREESILQSRSLLILGFLTKSGASDTLASRIIKIASEVAEQDMRDARTLKIAVSSVYSLSRLVEGLESNSIFFTKLFWVAFSMAQIDSILSYQGSLQFLGRTFSSMAKYDRFLDGSLMKVLLEERSMFGKSIIALEDHHGFSVTEKNIDSCLLYVITKGLHLPYTKHISIEVLKDCFHIRYLNEVKLSEKTGQPINPSCFGFLVFIFMLSATDEKLDKYLLKIGFQEREVVQLDDKVKIPKIVLDFFAASSYEAVSVLLQASLYFVSNSADENARYRYLLMYRYISTVNSKLRFLVYPDVRENFKQICISSSSLPILNVVYDIVTDTSTSPQFAQLNEYVKIKNQILKDHKVTGIESMKLSTGRRHFPADDTVTSFPSVPSSNSLLLKEILQRVVSSFVETE